MSRTAFVTGATGFVGLNLVQALQADDWRIVAFHRPDSDLSILGGFGVDLAVGDVADAASLRRAMPEGPDAVFHVAASTNMWSRRNAEQTRCNVDGTRAVCEVSLEKGARRLVHTSSIAAYGFHDGPIDESTPQRSTTSWINYLRTKGLAEVEVRRAIGHGLDAVIVNPANIMGPYDLHNWSSTIYLAHSGRLPAAPPGGGSFCHVAEVARAHIAAWERAATGSNHLLGGADASYLELIGEVGRVVGRKVPTAATPAWRLRWLARLLAALSALSGRRPKLTPEVAELSCRGMYCRSDTAERELGYRPVALRAMIEDCHRWMRDAGRLNPRE